MENEMISKRQQDWRLGTISLSCQAAQESMEMMNNPRMMLCGKEKILKTILETEQKKTAENVTMILNA